MEEEGFPSRRQNIFDPDEIQNPNPFDSEDWQSKQVLKTLPEQTASESNDPEEDIYQKHITTHVWPIRLIKQWREKNPQAAPRTGARPRPFQIRTIVLSENARRALGENGLLRLFEFSEFRAGWDAGRGQPLSIGSLSSLEWFLDQLPELSASEPSLFLTRNGNLQLVFENARGDAIEIEFFPNKLEYYFEGGEEEGSLELTNTADFTARLRTLIA
jgi:hypothetical protein